MPTNICAVTGDIVDEAPRFAEASVLWLRSGFNLRKVTWFNLLERYPILQQHNPPWMQRSDQVITVPSVPGGSLRFLYFYANPLDGKGCRDLREVRTLVRRCLATLADNKVKTVAMMQIPLAAAQGQNPQRFWDNASAAHMIAAIHEWGAENPRREMKVYLVDLKGHFGQIIQRLR